MTDDSLESLPGVARANPTWSLIDGLFVEVLGASGRSLPGEAKRAIRSAVYDFHDFGRYDSGSVVHPAGHLASGERSAVHLLEQMVELMGVLVDEADTAGDDASGRGGSLNFERARYHLESALRKARRFAEESG